MFRALALALFCFGLTACEENPGSGNSALQSKSLSQQIVGKWLYRGDVTTDKDGTETVTPADYIYILKITETELTEEITLNEQTISTRFQYALKDKRIILDDRTYVIKSISDKQMDLTVDGDPEKKVLRFARAN